MFWLSSAALLFLAAWALMPGVGITDAADILQRVGAQRAQVKLSVSLQLLSAALYVPGLLALALRAHAERSRGLLAGAALLLVGAAGSAADSVFHWLAVEMTAPGVERAAMLPVMARMQGPALVAVAPLIASFFLGSYLSIAAAGRARWISPGYARLFPLTLLIAPLATLLAPDAMRLAALLFLAALAAGQAWLGTGLAARIILSAS
jgi:hypothetical protein